MWKPSHRTSVINIISLTISCWSECAQSVGINDLFLAISTHSAGIFLYTRPALWFLIPENTSAPVLILSSVLFWFVFIFFFPFPAPSIQLALQIQTKQSRSVPNTNKDHIFSTRLHAVNCQPEGKVQDGGGSSARGHLTAGSQSPAWADRDILLTSNTMSHCKICCRDIFCPAKFLFWFTCWDHYVELTDTPKLAINHQAPMLLLRLDGSQGLTKYPGLRAPWSMC